MRHIVVVLTIVSATFAGTTVYFARELQLERERSLPTPVPVAQATLAHTSLPGASARQLAQQPPKTPPAVAENQEQNVRKVQAEQATRMLKAFADPEQRESMLVEYKLMMRNSFPRLAEAIGLSSEESERLLTLLAQQQLEQQERYAQCISDSGCSSSDASLYKADSRDQEIADLLGAQRQQQFETYKNTLSERESVTQFRARLPEAQRLPENKAEALITLLADERQRIHMEAAQRGIGMNSYGTGVGMVFSAVDAETSEARMESARANSRRMHDRAAEVLNAEQLRVFDATQEELLVSMRNQLRRKEEMVQVLN